MSGKLKTAVLGAVWLLCHAIIFSTCMNHAMTWYFDYPFSRDLSMAILLGTEVLILVEYLLIMSLNSKGFLPPRVIELLLFWDTLLLVTHTGYLLLLLLLLIVTHTGPGTGFDDIFGFFTAWALHLQLVFPKIKLLQKRKHSIVPNMWFRVQTILAFIPLFNILNLLICLLHCKKRGMLKKCAKILLLTMFAAALLCITIATISYALVWAADRMHLDHIKSSLIMLFVAVIPYGMPLFTDLGMIKVQYKIVGQGQAGQGDGS